jgi:hypothetical protein
MDPDPAISYLKVFLLITFEGTFTSKSKRSSRNQGFFTIFAW